LAPENSKCQIIKDMLKLLTDEFNCNHQADANSGHVNIYSREKEEEAITQFLVQNIKTKHSGLMYLCGHPGTGKTSLLN
jgi:DNA replication protein DnaC